MRPVARIVLSSVQVLALLLPLAVAAVTALHAIEHEASHGAPLEQVAGLAAHGHTHAALTPPHDHDAPPPAGAASPLPSPAPADVMREAPPYARDVASLRVPLPRARGSGGDLLLRLSCVLLL